MVAIRMMEQGNVELRCISGRDEGESWLCDSAHLVQGAVFHCILGCYNVIAEVAA